MFMDNSLYPRTWRSKPIKTTLEEEGLTIGEQDLIKIEKKFVFTITNFIRSVFNYDKIKVTLKKKQAASPTVHSDLDGPELSGYTGDLEDANGHTKFHFAIQLFNDQFYEYKVTNIPATIDSPHIQIFFRVLMQYVKYFYESIKNEMPLKKNGHIEESPSFVAKSDIWLYNINRTIMVEYIYNLFNTYNEDYTNEFKWAPSPIRYDVDLVNKILDFAFELSTKKVENKEIYCGFIFHDKADEVHLNSIRSIKFDKEFDFGDFAQIKNYLEVSNGQNIFFNVSGEKVTHIFITKNKVNEIYLNPIGDGKTFESRPLILSIQGSGKIHFLEGRSDNNKVILQIIDSKPIIRDNNFIKKIIVDSIEKFSSSQFKRDEVEIIAKWIMSLSVKKHGTSLIFKELTPKEEEKLVKAVRIKSDNNSDIQESSLEHDISLLNSMVSIDGAVIFNSRLTLTHISAILPINETAIGITGGARHNSVANFTKVFKCTGIVISEDGPITIFRDGEKLIKF